MKDIKTPDLGGAAEVTVIEVLAKPGDKIEAETSIVTLESDKATMDVPAGYAGVVKTVKVKVGDHIASGSVLVSLEIEDASEQSAAIKPAEVQAETKPAQAAVIASPVAAADEDEDEDEDAALSETSSDDVHAGPGVRRLARELGVNLTRLTGSGPKQRILKEDVQQYVKHQLSAAPQASEGGFSLPAMPVIDFSTFGKIETRALSRIKKISGKLLQRNAMLIPHVTQFGEADITEMEAYRQSQKAQMDKQQIKLTPLVFIMKAVVAALKAFPTFNASLDATGENLILKHYIHIGVAVDTPDGLVVPVIRDVDQKGLITLAQELAELSEKARKKQLTPKEMQGGCFSISSLGGIGGTAFTPIINAPEVAILGISKASYKPVYAEGVFQPRLMLPLSLSYDHRVIDGAEGARFMVYLMNVLSDIRHLLL